MIKKIPFTDINPLDNRKISKIKNDIYKIIKKRNFILGSEVNEFEKNFTPPHIKTQTNKISFSDFFVR